MHPKSTWIALVAPATLCLALWPGVGFASDTAPSASPLTLTVTRATGAEAVVISGTSLNARMLEATLYATYSRDLPTVFLSRRSVAVAADGTFIATLPTAPAYFHDAIVTVVIRAPKDGTSTTARVSVAAPNIDTPADAFPR